LAVGQNLLVQSLLPGCFLLFRLSVVSSSKKNFTLFCKDFSYDRAWKKAPCAYRRKTDYVEDLEEQGFGKYSLGLFIAPDPRASDGQYEF
jgi:hypothetical protein